MITHIATSHSKLSYGLVVTMLLLGSIFTGSNRAHADSSDLVNSLPAQIPEILTGGSWTNGNIGGVYRAVVVLSKVSNQRQNLLKKTANGPETLPTERKAEVFIQWISYANGKATAKIVKTVSIKEFNEKQLRHAFLAMDTLKENEMTLLVTSYDENSDKDVSISVKATAPGKYEPASNGK